MDADKTREQLINELAELRQRNTELEALSAKRRRIEEELQKHRDYLEELVRERSRELTGTIEQLQSEIAERNRVEQALREAEGGLRHRLEFEKLVTSISTDFMGLALDELGDGLNQVLGTIGEFFDVDHSYAFLFHQDGTLIESIYEWYAEDVGKQMTDFKGYMFDVEFPWLAGKMKQFEIVNIACVADLTPEAHVEKERFQERGVRSFVAVPMVYSDSLIGFLGFESIQAEKTWSDDAIARLRIVERILANALGRRRAELILRDNELKYRALVENTNEAIIVIQDGMIKFLNPRTMELTGYSETELMSRPFQDFIHPDDQEMVLDHHLGILKAVKPPQVPAFRIVDREGEIRWLESSTVVVTWHGRPGSAILHFLNDITERKRMEEELLKIQKLESVGVLAGGIAHDFNNILTAILGNISLAEMYLEPGTASGKVIERLREAERASMQARELTQQLLTFSKGGAPVKELATIGEIAKDAATFASRGSNVVCEFSIPDDLWLVEIDPGQINQVINNLVINADQAMPKGGTIKLQAENISIGPEDALPLEDGEYIKLSVKDQGVGIPEAIIQNIFDPFFTTKQAGNGLGLASSYSIIQKHNGYITVESEMGVGTTFHIYLPASTEKTLITEKKEEATPIMGNGRILVMDDESHIRDLTAAVLSKLGYSVSTSMDGAEAIRLYQEAENSGRPYDAVIVDLTIPGGMGGKETVERLMEIDPNVKAIVSSGYSTDPVMSNFREYGFQGVIAKPYKIMELSAVLHEVANE